MSWSPIARCSSAATTEESTPPDSAEQHAILADLLAHARDRVRDDVAGVPERVATADPADEALEDRGARTGVGHFRVELHAVEARAVVRHRRERRIRGRRDRRESRRHRLDAVAMAHPDVEDARIRRAFVVNAVEQARRRRAPDLGVAELAMRGRRDAAAELRRHRLHAVADAEDRHAELEHGVRRAAAASHP